MCAVTRGKFQIVHPFHIVVPLQERLRTMGISLLNLLPPTSWQCLSHPQLCQCNDLWFCLKTGGVMWSKLNKCYKFKKKKKVSELTEIFSFENWLAFWCLCGSSQGSFLGVFESRSNAFGSILLWKESVYSVTTFHLFLQYPRKSCECNAKQLSWTPGHLLMVLDCLQHWSRIPDTPCILPGTAHCCWLVWQYRVWKQKDTLGAAPDAAKTASSGGTRCAKLCRKLEWNLKHSSVLRTLQFRFFHHLESVWEIWFSNLCCLPTGNNVKTWGGDFSLNVKSS